MRKLTDGERFGPVDLDVHGGEIVAVVGVEGNGQAEFVELLIGLRKATGGGVAVDDIDITDMTTQQRFNCGIAHIPEDRHRLAVADGMSVVDNASIGFVDGAPFAPTQLWLSRRRRARFAAGIVRRHKVRAASIEAPVTSLSGGNQQKLVVGRELARAPRLMIAAQPTRGLDIGSTAAVHEALIGLRDQGGAVLLLSLDLTEVFTIADRNRRVPSGPRRRRDEHRRCRHRPDRPLDVRSGSGSQLMTMNATTSPSRRAYVTAGQPPMPAWTRTLRRRPCAPAPVTTAGTGPTSCRA